jgi:hypothetical protein
MNDGRSYAVSSSFHRTGDVDDVPLSESVNGTTRKVLRAELVKNPSNASNSVKVCIVHQKRQSKDASWGDLPGTSLVQTTASLPSKFPLDTSETRALFDYLCDFYKMGSDEILQGREIIRVAEAEEWIHTDRTRSHIIRKLLEAEHGEEVWKTLLELQPALAQQLSAALINHRRRRVIDAFAHSLSEDLPEEYWRTLLRGNPWIFGGSNVSVIDESRIDISHIADIPFQVTGGFMDIVELKKPGFPFWTMSRTGRPWKYRGKFLVPHPELNGAIAQTRHYILQAEKQVSDVDFHKQHGVVPLKPRGLVVHGRSSEWGSDEWEAFRLLNDDLHGVQIITFDHLLEQGKRSMLDEVRDIPGAT